MKNKLDTLLLDSTKLSREGIKIVDRYKSQGFNNREAYLEHLSDVFGIHLYKVTLLASMLGPSEDFDGLINALTDEALDSEERDYWDSYNDFDEDDENDF